MTILYQVAIKDKDGSIQSITSNSVDTDDLLENYSSLISNKNPISFSQNENY